MHTFAPASAWNPVRYSMEIGMPEVPGLGRSTYRLDVNLADGGPIGSFTIDRLVGGRHVVDRVEATDDAAARSARSALVEALRGVDYLRFGAPTGSAPLEPTTIRFSTSDASGASRSATIASGDVDVERFDALGTASQAFIAAAFGSSDW